MAGVRPPSMVYLGVLEGGFCIFSQVTKSLSSSFLPPLTSPPLLPNPLAFTLQHLLGSLHLTACLLQLFQH